MGLEEFLHPPPSGKELVHECDRVERGNRAYWLGETNMTAQEWDQFIPHSSRSWLSTAIGILRMRTGSFSSIELTTLYFIGMSTEGLDGENVGPGLFIEAIAWLEYGFDGSWGINGDEMN